ncbi:MAG: hypothetical protein JXA21_25205 [Anaerolineae bacterium]|nr:hypothetical protein [Anaerolineae bacterium]
MWPLILVYIALFVLFIIPIIFLTRWANRYVTRDLENRLSAIQVIVNEESIPGPWRAPFIKQAADIRLKNGTPAQLAQIEEKAKKMCLRQMDEMIKYCENFNIADGDATQRSLLDELRRHRARWATMSWEGQLEVEASPPEPAE